jgi:transcription termination factor NusB
MTERHESESIKVMNRLSINIANKKPTMKANIRRFLSHPYESKMTPVLKLIFIIMKYEHTQLMQIIVCD